MIWTDGAVRQALGQDGDGTDTSFRRVVTDSRTIQPGDLFVALEGDRFDGHAFLSAARDAGATAAVVRQGTGPIEGLSLYAVPDPLRAYGLLARARRRAVSGPVVAITGTNGKTSTKEMIRATLGTRYRAHATRSNLNNLVGVPQTILDAPEAADALVIEAGTNLPGEIARYREIIEPTLAVVTNVAAGHLEGFGSLDGVLIEKLELVRGVGTAIVGTDPPDLALRARRAGAVRVVSAGLESADVTPDRVELEPSGRARLTIGGRQVTLSLLGLHQARNAMIAWTVGQELGCDPDRVAAALGQVSVPGGRGELVDYGGLTLFNDCYNANPASFRAAIATARALRGNRRLVFVAGTMRELGPDSPRLHFEIAEQLVDLEPDLLAAVGDFVAALGPFRSRLGDRLVVAPDATTMGPLLAARLEGTELVVLKGSRGVALEKVIPDLVARTSHPSRA